MTGQESVIQNKSCPFCSESILATAIKCKHCGEFVDEKARKNEKRSPVVALLLSIIFPGAGQMYNGTPLRGLVYFFITLCGYLLFVLPGLLLHFAVIMGAVTHNLHDGK